MIPTDPTLEQALAESPLAAGLDGAQRSILAGLLAMETHPKGKVLADEGSVDNRLYAVVSGALSLVRHMGTPDETLTVTLKPGDFAHELGFLDGAERHASLVVAEDARLLVLERERLESLIDTHPRILYAVMCAIVRVVHQVQTRLSVQASELTNYIVKQHGRY